LVTIPEDEAIDLTLASPQHRINLELQEEQPDGNPERKNISENYVRLATELEEEELTTRKGRFSVKRCDLNEEEQLHSMTRFELLALQRETREEKKKFRRILKENEEIQARDRGKLRPTRQPEDKIQWSADISSAYANYKNAKAKLKLIEALLSKRNLHDQHLASLKK